MIPLLWRATARVKTSTSKPQSAMRSMSYAARARGIFWYSFRVSAISAIPNRRCVITWEIARPGISRIRRTPQISKFCPYLRASAPRNNTGFLRNIAIGALFWRQTSLKPR